jgi:dTDP-4-dehydrorhamnose reductase
VKRWLITGAGGQLGHHLIDALADDDVVALARAELDIADSAAVDAAIDRHRPEIVVNAAAYTAVDAAEADEDRAYAINATGPGNLAAAVRRTGGRLIHVSTDYVFAGDEPGRPYEPDDPTGPRTAYGRTKLAGEAAVLATLPSDSHVVRTAWVYGGPGPNFVDTMRRLAGERDTLSVVDDQVGSPTWVGDLASALVALGRSETPPGVLHYVNAGQTSWCGLARAVFARLGWDPARVQAITTDQFPRPAQRPGWSVLSTAAWEANGLPTPRPWSDALTDALRDG